MTVFRHTAVADATHHAAQPRTDRHPVGERLPGECSDDRARGDAAGKDASPRETTPDTDAPVIVQSVMRGRCRRVRPIISCRFATATMSDAARRLLLFATVCKSTANETELRRECRHRRPVIMAAKAPGSKTRPLLAPSRFDDLDSC
jgi:hypothetical protein